MDQGKIWKYQSHLDRHQAQVQTAQGGTDTVRSVVYDRPPIAI